MSDKPTVLVQLDTDPLPSAFDRVVAVDAGTDHVFAYGGVTPENVHDLVHGCIFTRGPKDLHRTAVFVGGSDVAAGEAVLAAVRAALLPQKVRAATLQVAIDLNAVPPAGIEGVEAIDAGAKRDGVVGYGALGVGGTKMKVHKAAVAKLFERNDQVFDAEEVYELAQQY